MARCCVGPGQTDRAFVLIIGVCLNLKKVLFVFDTVWGHNITLLMYCLNTLPGTTIMVMAAVRSCSLNVWHGVVVLARANRTCVCIGVCLNLKSLFVFDTAWCRNIISRTVIQIHYNGNGGGVFMFVECMNDTVSCWPWTNSSCVCIGVCLKSNLLFVFDAVWWRNLTVMCCPTTLNGADDCVFVECMAGTMPWTNRWYVYFYMCEIKFEGVIRVLRSIMRSQSQPGVLSKYTTMSMTAVMFIYWLYGMVSRWPWTNRTCVCIGVCVWIWRLYSCLIQHEVVISPDWCTVVQNTTMTIMAVVCSCSLNVWHGVLLALDEQTVRLCLKSNLLFVFDAVWWRSNLTVPNYTKWCWRLCVYYVRWMYGWNNDALDEQIVRLHICEIEFEGVICVLRSMRS